MANHLTPEEVAKELGIAREEVIRVCIEEGVPIYHGRIDNRYADLGVSRPQATERDLRDALAAIVAGNPVPHHFVKAIGCSISPP